MLLWCSGYCLGLLCGLLWCSGYCLGLLCGLLWCSSYCLGLICGLLWCNGITDIPANGQVNTPLNNVAGLFEV